MIGCSTVSSVPIHLPAACMTSTNLAESLVSLRFLGLEWNRRPLKMVTLVVICTYTTVLSHNNLPAGSSPVIRLMLPFKALPMFPTTWAPKLNPITFEMSSYLTPIPSSIRVLSKNSAVCTPTR